MRELYEKAVRRSPVGADYVKPGVGDIFYTFAHRKTAARSYSLFIYYALRYVTLGFLTLLTGVGGTEFLYHYVLDATENENYAVFAGGACIFLAAALFAAGFIWLFRYYMTFYICDKNPDITVSHASALSKKLMKGRKYECTLIQLSFILWHVLGILTLGTVETTFVIPYQVLTNIAYSSYIYDTAFETSCSRINVNGSDDFQADKF